MEHRQAAPLPAVPRHRRQRAAPPALEGLSLLPVRHPVRPVAEAGSAAPLCRYLLLRSPGPVVTPGRVLRAAVAHLKAVPLGCTALTGPYWYGQGWKDAVSQLEELAACPDLLDRPPPEPARQVRLVVPATWDGRVAEGDDTNGNALMLPCRTASGDHIAVMIPPNQVADLLRELTGETGDGM